MALIVKETLIKEDILNEKGEKIGELKFNPNDSNIIYKLGKIVKDLTSYMEKVKKMGDLPDLQNKEPENVEEFEQLAESFNKINERLEVEDEAITGALKDLEEVFGKETINLFTKGTKDIDLIMPLIEYVIPFVEKSRNKKISKYVNIVNDVME